FTMWIASKSQTFTQLPNPVQPYSQAFGPPPGTLMADTQSSLPKYLYLEEAFSQVPAHLTKATIFSISPVSTPMISPIFAATAGPPTGQAETGASPCAIAFARASQPANPQPPQLLPGRHSLTAISFSSTGTLNFSEAIPRRIEITRPVPPTTAAARIIPVTLIFSPFPTHLLRR